MNFFMVIMASGIARTHDHNHDEDDDGVAQDGGHTPSNKLTETCSLGLPFTSLILDIHVTINDTCQNKVSADQYHVTISRAQVCSSSRLRVFWSWPLTKYWFSIGSRAHVVLTSWKPGKIVRKPANGSPGLKFIWIIAFSSIQMFFAALICFEYMVIINLKTESQIVNRKPHPKVTKLKSAFYLSLG